MAWPGSPELAWGRAGGPPTAARNAETCARCDAVCGRYVTEGMDVVGQLRSGDTIVRATVLSGADKLVLPAPAKVAALAAGAPGRST